MVYHSRMKADKPRQQLLAAGGDGMSTAMDGTSHGQSGAGSLPGMQSSNAEALRERGVERTRTLSLSLARLSGKNSEKREYIVKNGAIPTLVQLADRSSDHQVQSSCATAFVNFAKDESFRREIIKEGGARAMSHLSHGADNSVRYDYLQALINLSATSGTENDLIHDGAVSYHLIIATTKDSIIQ